MANHLAAYEPSPTEIERLKAIIKAEHIDALRQETVNQQKSMAEFRERQRIKNLQAYQKRVKAAK